MMLYDSLIQSTFLYFVHLLKVKKKNRTFRKAGLLPSSGNEVPNLLGLLGMKGQSPKEETVNDRLICSTDISTSLQ